VDRCVRRSLQPARGDRARLLVGVYGRLAFVVSDGGLIVRTVSAVRHIDFADILRVDVVPGPLGTSYAVRTRAGSVQFSSLFGGHERLCSLIVRGAGLV
jgi:hypothetical protein